jgi:hypothetical protein
MFRFSFSGNSSVLTENFFPPIHLDRKYICGLLSFSVYNSIPNIKHSCDAIHFDGITIFLNHGAYELQDIFDYITEELKNKHQEKNIKLKMEANLNTLKVEIFCSNGIHFEEENTIGKMLGFSKKYLDANEKHVSDLPVDIMSVNTIRISCDIITNSFINGKQSNILHEFVLSVPPGYKINESPSSISYLPLTTDEISSITIKILDQDGNLVDFQGENIVANLQLLPC